MKTERPIVKPHAINPYHAYCIMMRTTLRCSGVSLSSATAALYHSNCYYIHVIYVNTCDKNLGHKEYISMIVAPSFYYYNFAYF